MSDYIIYPDIFKNGGSAANIAGGRAAHFGVKAFFTGRAPGADIDELAKISGVSRENIYFPRQEHTAGVMELKEDMSIQIADAVITARRDVLIGVQVADCVPILVHAKDSGLIAAVHAGWRGTAKGVLKAALRKMLDSSGPESIFMAIGPAIRGGGSAPRHFLGCYEVGRDVLEAVAKETGEGDYYKAGGSATSHIDGRATLDLPSANRIQALGLGIPEGNIWMSDECTYCRPDRVYSYRYSGGTAANMGGGIAANIAGGRAALRGGSQPRQGGFIRRVYA